METQLRLDQCIGKKAWELRDTLKLLSQRNQEIQKLRIAIQAAYLQPELIPPLETALMGVVAHQEFTLLNWQKNQIQWLATKGCGRKGDYPIPLPSLHFLRKPPDRLGPHPLQWKGSFPTAFHLQAGHPPRYAAAKVTSTQNKLNGDINFDPIFQDSSWKTHWTTPQKFPRANFY